MGIAGGGLLAGTGCAGEEAGGHGSRQGACGVLSRS